jgi:hypothetical protein
VIRQVRDGQEIAGRPLRAQPTGAKAALPAAWYAAAERVAGAREATLGFAIRPAHVRSIALDSWRCDQTSVASWM